MKKAKGKKKRLNRKKVDKSVNKHIRHERIGNFLYYGEEIVKELLDKIISLSITMQNTNRIYSNLGNICFNHVKKEVTYFLKQEFIVYERDDLIFPEFHLNTPSSLEPLDYIETIPKISNVQENNTLFSQFAEIIPSNENTKLSYDFNFEKDNFWGIIPQPPSTIKDREASTQIDYLKCIPHLPNKEENESNSNKKKDINKALLDTSNKMHYKKKSSTSSLNIHYSNITNTDRIVNNQKESSPHKKALIANLPCFDIPNEKLQLINELPEINILRLEKEKQIKEKEEEIKKQNKITNNETEINKNYLSNKHKDKKLFTKYTIDSQGEILSIKPIPLDKLVMEFSIAKYQQKEVKQMSNSVFNKNKSPSSPQKQTDNNNKKPEVIKNPYLPDNISYKIEKSSPQLTKLTSNDTTHKNTNSTGIVITTNLGISRTLANKLSSKRQISPCGSSFDLMKPEVGVTILEDSKVKSGGKDFFKKYNRLSVEHYKQAFKETLLNKTSSAFEFFPKNNNNLNTNFNTPLHTLKPIELKLKKTNSNKDYFSFQGSSLKKVNSAANIRMANHKFTSIRSAMDNLDLYNEQDELKSTKDKKNELLSIQNIFENMKKTIYKKKPCSPIAIHSNQLSQNSSVELSEINKFNKTLINSKQWGKVVNCKEKFLYHYPRNHIKSPKKVSQREISLYISNIKMPRDRIKQSAQEVLMNNTMKYFNRQKLLQQKGITFYKQNNIIEPINKDNNN